MHLQPELARRLGVHEVGVGVTGAQPDLWKSWVEARLEGAHLDADEHFEQEVVAKQASSAAVLRDGASSNEGQQKDDCVEI